MKHDLGQRVIGRSWSDGGKGTHESTLGGDNALNLCIKYFNKFKNIQDN